MKTITIFYVQNNSYANENIYKGQTAKSYCDEWAKALGYDIFTVTAQTGVELFEALNKVAAEQNADSVIFAWNDCPFLNVALTKEIVENHIEYKSEYTFADGYPYGFAPEVIDSGTLKILLELARTSQEAEGKKKVVRETVFNLINTDINSFDVESVLADEDWRLLRFAFHCGTKDSFMQCKALFQACSGKKDDVNELAKTASKTLACLKTVPGFYNIQISDFISADCVYSPFKKGDLPDSMNFEKFCLLVEQIAELSQNAVVSLSKAGEIFAHAECLKIIEKVLSYSGLSVFIETDGLFVTPELCEQLEKIVSAAPERTNGWQKIMIAVRIDAFSEKTYRFVYPDCEESAFQKAVASVSALNKAAPGCVYPQFVRMEQNESELESFYRYWNEKSNASDGNLIIQKYNSFAGRLPERKVADLSPIDRNICWHLRRDMDIFANGNVYFCNSWLNDSDGLVGNVFEEKLCEIWNKNEKIIENIEKKYCGKCKNCDEYYTFNF